MRRLATLLLAAFLAGCAAVTPPREPPEVYLINLVPGGPTGLFEQTLLTTVRVVNPNPTDIDFEGMTFNLYVNDRRLASGVTNEAVHIPALGESIVNVTARTDPLTLARQLFGLADQQRLAYRLTGQIYIQGLVDLTVPYETAGSLNLGGANGLIDPAHNQ